MIIPTRWRDILGGDRVIDPAGRLFHVLPRNGVLFLVQLRGQGSNTTHTMTVDPDANVARVYDIETQAIASLRAAFNTELELIKEG